MSSQEAVSIEAKLAQDTFKADTNSSYRARSGGVPELF